MEDSRKNNDCYFYYYSTCLKGDDCTFRHEPAARGSETVCSFWTQGKCSNTSCNFRHMELKKNRKTIPCYWESQPSGCRKSHCPFQHKGSRDSTTLPDNDLSNDCDASAAAKPAERQDFRNHRPPHNDGRDSSDDGSRRGGGQEFAPVDPLVVRFEEESDSESAAPPSRSPRKPSRAATQEQLHLLRIQAEAAAYYSYEDEAPPPAPSTSPHDFRVLSLAEIRAAVKRSADASSEEPESKTRRECSPMRFQEAEPSIRPGGRVVRLRRPAPGPLAKVTVTETSRAEPRPDLGRVTEGAESESRPENPCDRRANGNGLARDDASEEMAAEELLLGNTTMAEEEVLDEDLLLDD